MTLGDKPPVIIGMDLFDKLGLKMSNIPITWPPRMNQEKDLNLDDKDVSEKNKVLRNALLEEKSSQTDDNGIADEWRKVLEDNLSMPESSTCKLSNSTLGINTGDNKPSGIRQYPIPQALLEKVNKQVQLWL